ncbi:MAG: hypothetical protein AAGA36_00115 [Pseudomonadota bacterium]
MTDQTQREYAFDVKLWTCARIKAGSLKEAKAKLANYADCLDVGLVSDDGVTFTEASAEGDYDLIEIDGECVFEGDLDEA